MDAVGEHGSTRCVHFSRSAYNHQSRHIFSILLSRCLSCAPGCCLLKEVVLEHLMYIMHFMHTSAWHIFKQQLTLLWTRTAREHATSLTCDLPIPLSIHVCVCRWRKIPRLRTCRSPSSAARSLTLHAKLIVNFSHESDVTSLDPFLFYYCVPHKIRRGILLQTKCRYLASPRLSSLCSRSLRHRV